MHEHLIPICHYSGLWYLVLEVCAGVCCWLTVSISVNVLLLIIMLSLVCANVSVKGTKLI